jgi:hypothetical protein
VEVPVDDLSILETTRRQCGLEPDNTDYDIELITHINSMFFVLQQLGVGPEEGFLIFDDTAKWSDFIRLDQIAAVISYMGLRVRMLFDPPPTGPATEAMERQAGQLEWRLNIHAEGVKWDELSRIYSQKAASE